MAAITRASEYKFYTSEYSVRKIYTYIESNFTRRRSNFLYVLRKFAKLSRDDKVFVHVSLMSNDDNRFSKYKLYSYSPKRFLRFYFRFRFVLMLRAFVQMIRAFL